MEVHLSTGLDHSGTCSTVQPQLDISISKQEGQVISRHVVRLTREQKNACPRLGLEIERHMKITVSILEGWKGDVAVTGQFWDLDICFTLAGLPTPPQWTKTLFIPLAIDMLNVTQPSA